nr:MAG: putative transmembrane protein [Polycipiviridae sp.]
MIKSVTGILHQKESFLFHNLLPMILYHTGRTVMRIYRTFVPIGRVLKIKSLKMQHLLRRKRPARHLSVQSLLPLWQQRKQVYQTQ